MSKKRKKRKDEMAEIAWFARKLATIARTQAITSVIMASITLIALLKL
ncbi:hypothetical protein I6E29_09015 [Arcanobacterium haemolyticum]|nr:hypothetical protein [Arcanobacterium haemolyticum]